MRKYFIGLSLLALGLAGGAVAAEPMPGGDATGGKTMTKAEFQAKGAKMFARMDVNKDGKLNQADRAAHRGQMFDRVDANHDAALSRDEFMTAHQRGPMGKHGGHGGHDGMMLRMADTNQDAAVSKDEFMAAHVRHFDMMDANHDGQLTKSERQAAHAKMGGMRHGGKHDGHPMGAMGDMPPPPLPPVN